MVKEYSVRYDAPNIQVSYADHRTAEPWVSLVGDCFFRNLHRDFSVGPLAINDCPLTVCFPRVRIDPLMDYVERVLPLSTEWVVVHVGVNNLASSKFTGCQAAAMLLSRCLELLRLRPRINEISICLLSPRLQDARGSYSLDYILRCNTKMVEFNHLISQWVARAPKFTSIDFGLLRGDLRGLLRETGFGVNETGRFYIAEKIQSIIIYKCITGKGPKLRIPRPLAILAALYGDPRFWHLQSARRRSTSSHSAPMSPQSSSDGQ